VDRKIIVAGAGLGLGVILAALMVKVTAAKPWTLTLGVFSDKKMKHKITGATVGDTIYIGGFFAPLKEEPVVGSEVTAFMQLDTSIFKLGSYVIKESDVFEFNMAWYVIEWTIPSTVDTMNLGGKTVSIWVEAVTPTKYQESSQYTTFELSG